MATSYANTGGTGNRTGIITVTTSASLLNSGTASNLVDGATGANSTDATDWLATAAAGGWIQFDFGSRVIIDEVTWKQSNTLTHGHWRWEGSLDATNWVPLSSPALLGGTAQVIPFPNLLSYRYYRVLGVKGTKSSSPWLLEVEFKIEAGPGTLETSRYDGSPGSGDRTADITVTSSGVTIGAGTVANLVDGAFVDNSTDAIWFSGGGGSSAFIRFEFDTRYVIDRAMSFRSTNTAQGVWQWRGSDDGSAWTDIGATFNLGGAETQRHDELSGNTTPYQFYELRGVSGALSSTPWHYEFAFSNYIGSPLLEPEFFDDATMAVVWFPPMFAEFFDEAEFVALPYIPLVLSITFEDMAESTFLLEGLSPGLVVFYDLAEMIVTVTIPDPVPLPVQVVTIITGR